MKAHSHVRDETTPSNMLPSFRNTVQVTSLQFLYHNHNRSMQYKSVYT